MATKRTPRKRTKAKKKAPIAKRKAKARSKPGPAAKGRTGSRKAAQKAPAASSQKPVAVKLGVKPGHSVRVIGGPTSLVGSLPDKSSWSSADADVVVAFVENAGQLDERVDAVKSASAGAGLAWFCYPKAGALATDLNRDILREALSARGLEAVSLISVDDTWSALRVKPA